MKLQSIPIAIALVATVLAAIIPTSMAHNELDAPRKKKFGWMLNQQAIQLLQQSDPGGNLTDIFFNNERTYLMGKGPQSPPNSNSTITFCSFLDFQKAIANGKIPTSVRAVIYDNEGWSFTPPNEQKNPYYYMKVFGQLAHQNGLIFISAPACTIVKKIDPTINSDIYGRYIRLGLAASAARNADIYEIQAQGSINNTAQYEQFVQQASDQARAANPNIRVFAGLSTNPNGQPVKGEQLHADVVATKPYVNGYWLNIPAGGPYCPSCGSPQPKVAADLLRRMLASGMTADLAETPCYSAPPFKVQY